VLVRVFPWAEVYLGSRHLGTTPMRAIELPAGKHVLVLKNPQLKVERKVTVLVPRGGRATVKEDLRAR
jgi:serine/threonine-protein kinase